MTLPRLVAPIGRTELPLQTEALSFRLEKERLYSPIVWYDPLRLYKLSFNTASAVVQDDHCTTMPVKNVVVDPRTESKVPPPVLFPYGQALADSYSPRKHLDIQPATAHSDKEPE